MLLLQVRLGEHYFETTEGYEQDIDIAAVNTHSSYGVAVSHDRDIAVIKLASPAKFNSRVGPVCLQSTNADFPPGTYVDNLLTKLFRYKLLARLQKVELCSCLFLPTNFAPFELLHARSQPLVLDQRFGSG